MKVHINCKSYNRGHMHIQFFFDSINAGTLFLRYEEAFLLRDTLESQCKLVNDTPATFELMVSGHWPNRVVDE